MSEFVRDTFTDTPGTQLIDHVGEVGASWTIIHSRQTPLISTLGRCRGTVSANEGAYASGTPPTPEYAVEADFVALALGASDQNIYLYGRLDESPSCLGGICDHYEVHYFWSTSNPISPSQFLLNKYVGGVYTNLGAFQFHLVPGQSVRVTLDITDAAKRVLVNGIEVISSSDNEITGAGVVALVFNAIQDDLTGIHIDNFNAGDIAVASFVDAAADLAAEATLTAAAITVPANFADAQVIMTVEAELTAAGEAVSPAFADAAAELVAEASMTATGVIATVVPAIGQASLIAEAILSVAGEAVATGFDDGAAVFAAEVIVTAVGVTTVVVPAPGQTAFTAEAVIAATGEAAVTGFADAASDLAGEAVLVAQGAAANLNVTTGLAALVTEAVLTATGAVSAESVVTGTATFASDALLMATGASQLLLIEPGNTDMVAEAVLSAGGTAGTPSVVNGEADLVVRADLTADGAAVAGVVDGGADLVAEAAVTAGGSLVGISFADGETAMVARSNLSAAGAAVGTSPVDGSAALEAKVVMVVTGTASVIDLVIDAATFTSQAVLGAEGTNITCRPEELLHSPADIVRHLFIIKGLGSDPPAVPWPVYVAGEPSAPDEVVTVYDTAGRDSGRMQLTGARAEFFGIQVRVRSRTHKVGYLKAREIAVAMDQRIYREPVTLEGTDYVVHSLDRRGDVLCLGKQTPETKRDLFTVNALTSITKCC